jgi:hypothetical protein
VDAETHDYITPQIERRQHRRVKLVAEVRCAALGLDEVLVTRDVSIGGLFINTKQPLPEGAVCELSFRLRPDRPPVQCQGRVASSVAGLGMGINFINLNPHAAEALENFVDESY